MVMVRVGVRVRVRARVRGRGRGRGRVMGRVRADATDWVSSPALVAPSVVEPSPPPPGQG